MKIKPGKEEDYKKYVEINSVDPYSARVVSFSEDWAKLMEEQLAVGIDISICAGTCCSQADTDGITGYMYGASVEGLSNFWVHGEELRKWHNREYLTEEQAKQADESGATVNPAIVTINTDGR